MINPAKSDLIKPALSKEEMSKTFGLALQKKNLITDDDTALIFYDLSFIKQRIINLRELFPPGTLHAIAVKANPLAKILTQIKDTGSGLEVASLPELHLAEKVGFPPERIVFDSPSKTKKEIEYALQMGVMLNADSFAELERIEEILTRIKTTSLIGVRINPQVGAGTIKSTSVADAVSKFGIPLDNNREKLTEYYVRYNWLKGIHVHTGSQGMPVHLMIEGIRKVLFFANQVNKALEEHPIKRKIEIFDIGGGLAVSYHEDRKPVSMDEYLSMLKDNFKELFKGQFSLVTEFGRYIHANAGWAASKVEYVKRENGYNIIMTHVGADLLLRKCYNPNDWHHQITVTDKEGKIKTGLDKNKYMVAGPLCFAGDVIAKDLELPVVEEGDYILIHDIGAYTLSMWSRYNSRQIPKVIGYQPGQDDFEIIKHRENKEDIFEFWS